VKIIKNLKDYKLCYVEDRVAYFTNISLKKQTGDDWNDRPYEHNAGEPYSKKKDQIIKLMYSGYDINTPAELHPPNSPYSVDMINAGAVAWLAGRGFDYEPLYIQAGATIKEFIGKIEQMGGEVYYPESSLDK